MAAIINISNVRGLNGETPFDLASNPVQTLINTNSTVVRSFVSLCSQMSGCGCNSCGGSCNGCGWQNRSCGCNSCGCNNWGCNSFGCNNCGCNNWGCNNCGCNGCGRSCNNCNDGCGFYCSDFWTTLNSY